MTHIAALCLLATAQLTTPQAVQRIPVCVELAERAAERGFDPALIVSMAMEESRMDSRARSRAGARGVLQAIPKWHCPGGVADGCDFVLAGLNAIGAWIERFGGDWLCHYNAGNVCGRRSLRYARRVRARAVGWRVRLEVGL